MKFLLDANAKKITKARQEWPQIIGGQLLTPLTSYAYTGRGYAIDNGAFTRFEKSRFLALLVRQREHRDSCYFVAAPDVVGSARRTLEILHDWIRYLEGWPIALVMQDGIEDFDIPWSFLAAVFIGGSTEFKMSESAKHVIKAAQILGKHTHVGRVNTPTRFNYFAEMGVDTCDGSGASRWDWMLDKIDNNRLVDEPLFQAHAG